MTRKLVTLFLALAMVLTMVPAMAEDASALEPVTLDWYFGQSEQPDCGIVNDAINEYLTEKINTTVNLHYWAGTEYWEGTELEFVIMVIAVSCVKLLSAHNSTQHTSRKHKV